MRGTMWLVVAVVILTVVLVAAQTPTGSFLSLSASSGACPAPAAGVTTYCGGVASINGAPYASLQGPPGVAGAPGLNGTNGVAATVAVGTTTTGTIAAVTNVGTPNAAVLNFVLPQPSGVPVAFSCVMTLTPLNIIGGVVSYTASMSACH
jgi:hypothetical protein